MYATGIIRHPGELNSSDNCSVWLDSSDDARLNFVQNETVKHNLAVPNPQVIVRDVTDICQKHSSFFDTSVEIGPLVLADAGASRLPAFQHQSLRHH
jgi:hypothetical protein